MRSIVCRFGFGALLALLSAALLLGQGAQLPKYTVATLPSPLTRPTYTVQVIDGATASDCTVGGGKFNVICVASGASVLTINCSVVNGGNSLNGCQTQAGVVVGMGVTGPGLAPNTTVTGLIGTNQIGITPNAIATNAGTYGFGNGAAAWVPPPGPPVASQSIVWPPNCNTATRVYNYATNACVDLAAQTFAAGTTTTLPAGSPATVTSTGTYPYYAFNFGIPTGTPGGSLSYPGMTTDNNNGTTTQGMIQSQTMMQAPAVSAASLPGYRQSSYGARSRDRDGVLQVTVTPQDMPGCSQSGMGAIDDRLCWDAAIQYLATQGINERVVRKLSVPATRDGYTFRTTGYMQQLPFDFGDYHGYAGSATAASVTTQFTNGVLTSCTVSGGSSYAPSATLPVFIQDLTLHGSGAYATVATDATGLPTGCTVVSGGMNYPSTGNSAVLVPLGGDGAAGNCALSGGVFTSPCTVTAGGSGYAASVKANMAGLTCTTYPTLTTTVTSAVVTAVTTTAGSGCSYSGGATVPIQFGASCGGSQCTLITPEVPAYQACALNLISGLIIEGAGGTPTISAGWVPTSTINNTIPIIFCDATGTQGSNITIRNLRLDGALYGFYFPWEVWGLTLDNVQYGTRVAYEGYAYTFNANQYYPMSRVDGTSPILNLPLKFTNISSNSGGGWQCGGAWAGRNITGNSGASEWLFFYASYGTSSVAGNQTTLGHSAVLGHAWGRCGGITIDGYIRVASSAMTQAVTNAADKYVEQAIWKAQDGPASPITTSTTMSNGLATCVVFPTVVDRTTDYNWGYYNSNGGTFSNYPHHQCFPGAAISALVTVPRYSQGGDAPTSTATWPQWMYVNNVTVTIPWRPILNGRLDVLEARRINILAGGGTPSDIYTQATQVVGGINANGPIGPKIKVEDSYLNLQASGVTLTPINVLGGSLVGVVTRNVNGLADRITPSTGVTTAFTTTVPANSCINGPAAAIGSNLTSAAVAVTPTTFPGLGLSWTGYFPGNGTVQVVVCNNTTVSITPTSTTFQLRALP